MKRSKMLLLVSTAMALSTFIPALRAAEVLPKAERTDVNFGAPVPGKKPVSVSDDTWSDGNLQRKVETFADGGKTITYFDHDGKTLLLKQEFRKDGTMAYQRHRLLDGSTLAVRYKTNGDKQMERTNNPKSGDFTLKHYRVGKSTEVWFESVMDLLNGGPSTWQYFAKDGTTVKRVIDDTGMTVTVTGKQSKVQYTQQWSNADGKWKLQSVTDPATQKRFLFTTDANGKRTQSAVDHLKADGSLDRNEPNGKLQPPAAWLGEFDDDPTFPE